MHDDSNDFMAMITSLLTNEMNRPEVREKILQPLLRWLLWQIVPYILLIICLNFFLTIAAICLVLYFRR